MRTLTQEAPSEAPAREVRWVHIVYLDAPGTGLCGEPVKGPISATPPAGSRVCPDCARLDPYGRL